MAIIKINNIEINNVRMHLEPFLMCLLLIYSTLKMSIRQKKLKMVSTYGYHQRCH